MNNIIKSIVMITLLTTGACKKAKVDVNFNMDVANIYFIADTTSTTGDITFSSTQFNSELQAKLDDHDASAGDVKSIYITGAELVMVNPGQQNFDVIEKAFAYLQAGSLPETRVIYNENIPDGVTAVTMNADGTDLKEYMKQPVVNFRASGFLSALNLQRDTIQAKLTFKINAEVKP